MPRPWEEELLRKEEGSVDGAMLLNGAQGTLPVGAFRRGPDDGTRIGRAPIGRDEIAEATEILNRYKAGKANLEARVVEDELWWQQRHWEVIRRNNSTKGPEPTSGWLFNSILNKHADAMDNFWEPIVLPRERGDEESAKILSSVLPVIMEANNFEETYSQNWWEKLKHGTGVYGVFWDPKKENGLGDVQIKSIDLLKIFWEPGITDIQKSRNLFIVDLVDEDILDQRYPEHKGKMGGSSIDVKQYCYDDTVDTEGKSVVVDWYYKRELPDGRTVLHYAKFVGDVLLYSSENDEEMADGWYEHGKYPVVFDGLFPEKGTPVGFGYVAICKDPQMYIDNLSANIMESSMMGTRKRFFVSGSTNINEDEFLDWSKPLVRVEGELDDRRVKEIEVNPISGVYLDVMQLKIEEMKDTAANRDVNSGGAGSGVTAAAAISALQEAGNKTSRDMLHGSYRAATEITQLVIELLRQFYTEVRTFRITGAAAGQYEFVDFSGVALQEQPLPPVPGMYANGITQLVRKPVFDLKIKVQKRNPFSRMEQNERAKELYGLGFFNPERAQEAQGALEMMDFEGKDKVVEYVQQGQTLLNICQKMSQQMDKMAAIIQATTGTPMGAEVPAEDGSAPPPANGGASGGIADKAVKAGKANMTSYGQRLAARSSPSMNATSNAAAPR